MVAEIFALQLSMPPQALSIAAATDKAVADTTHLGSKVGAGQQRFQMMTPWPKKHMHLLPDLGGQQ